LLAFKLQYCLGFLDILVGKLMSFRKMRLLTLSLIASASVGMAMDAAYAAPVADVDGALYLQNELQKIMEMPNFGINPEGEVEVEAAGTYYAVTLPHLKLTMPTPPTQHAPQGGKFAFDFGISALNMVPTDVKGRYVFAQSIPTPWRFYTNDKETHQLQIGTQKTNGILDLPMQLATRMDAKYDDVKLVDVATGRAVLHADSVVAKGGYDENKPNFFTGRIPFEVNGLKIYGDTAEPLVTIGKIKAYSGYTDLSRENSMKCVTQMQRVNKQITSYIKTQQIVDPPVIAGFLDNALACLGIVADGIEGGLVIENVQVSPAIAAAAGMGNVKLESLYSQTFLTDISKDKMGLAIKLGMQNVELDPWPAHISKFAPRSFHVDIGVDNIPHSKLYEILRGVLGMYSKDAQSVVSNPAMVMMPVLARLPQILNEAQSGIVANDVRIVGDGYQVIMSGRVQSDLNAIYGASGKATITFYNMDTFIAGLTAEAQDPNNDNAMGAQGALKPLNDFKKYGKDDGKGNRVYDFELTQQGKVTLNGQDFREVFKAARQGGAAPAPQ
jgi:hypothetical protein|tara:strand:+ start:84648 stop:86312 length:1665 start_codon:yes stop_codon:yes gene_type:complete